MGLGYLVHQPGAPNRQRQLGWSYRPGCQCWPVLDSHLSYKMSPAAVYPVCRFPSGAACVCFTDVERSRMLAPLLDSWIAVSTSMALSMPWVLLYRLPRHT